MGLTDTQIRNTLKPKDKPYKKADDKGLYPLVNPDVGGRRECTIGLMTDCYRSSSTTVAGGTRKLSGT